ncbi:MAG: BatD family protein, partial [Chromatiales bacterium]
GPRTARPGRSSAPPTPAGNASGPWPGVMGAPQGRQQIQYSRYGASPYGTSQRGPRVEATLSASDAYAQQNLVYTVRILSDGNLSLADPVLPENPNFVFHQIDGPVTSSKVENGRQEIVNEFRYAVTPLRAGSFTLEPARVTGELARGGAHYDATAARPVSVEIAAPKEGIRPWLPLKDLTVQTRLQNAEQAAAGKPLSLVIEMKAVGATGSQLPSLEKQLESSDFRIYQEKVETHGTLSADGRQLEGRRIESYTLVPQHGGRIRIPSLRLSWWNVEADRAETLALPIRQLVAGGGLRGDGAFGVTESSTLFPAGSSLMFWLPLLGIAFLMGAYWSWIWAKNKGLIRAGATRLSRIMGLPGTQARRFAERHHPRRYLHLARQGAIRALPGSLRLWYCVRYADSETDPAEWCQMLKFLGHKHLGISPQLPMPEFGRRLIAAQPRADARAIRELMYRLDAEIYGSEELDFAAWKKEFRHALRPRLLPESRRPGFLRRASHKLPDLNPRSV